MPYYSQPDRIPKLIEALNHQTVDQLKALAQLLPKGQVPTRKAELVDYVQQRLQEESLKRLWNQCDRLQQAVISEVVHSTDDRYQAQRFVSKYGAEPTWKGKDERRSFYSYAYNRSILGLFFYNYTMPQDLKAQLKAFVLPPESTRIASRETLLPALSRTIAKYDHNTRQPQSITVEFPLSARETKSVVRRTCKPCCD